MVLFWIYKTDPIHTTLYTLYSAHDVYTHGIVNHVKTAIVTFGIFEIKEEEN